MGVSWVVTITALSLADSTTAKHNRWSSLAECKFLINVNNLTQCGSLRGSLNLSTQIHVEKLKPVWGGNILSPI